MAHFLPHMYLYKYVCEQMAVLRPVGRACLRLLTCFLFNIYTYLLGEHAIKFLYISQSKSS